MTVLIILLVACSAHADIDKWVDESGRTHFCENPPSDVSPVRIDKSIETSQNDSTNESSEKKWVDEKKHRLTEVIIEEKRKDHRDQVESYALDCDKAVSNAEGGIDFMLDVGKQNADAGYSDKSKYEQVAKELVKSKERISRSECESAEGDVKNFYECVINVYNEVAMCAEKYKYWDMILLGKK